MVTNVWEVVMNHVRFIRRVLSVVFAVGGSFLGFVLFAPSAFAMIVEPVGSGSSPATLAQPAPAVVHSAVAGGMAGWQIALIAVGAAVLTATLAVFADRARGSQRKVSMSAA
jgi:hypothetical protein